MRRALPRQESQEPRPWCNSESFTFPSNPVDWTDGGSICKMSCQAEEAGLRGEQEKRGSRELVPGRRNAPGPLLPGEEAGEPSDTAVRGGPLEAPRPRSAGGQQNPCPAAALVPPPALLRRSLLDSRFRHHALRPLPEATLTSLLHLPCWFHFFPPSHLPTQFSDLLLSRSPMTSVWPRPVGLSLSGVGHS